MRRSAVIGSLGALVVVAATMVTVSRRESPSAIAAPAFSTADVADEFVAGGNWRAAVAADWLPDGRMIVIRTTGEVVVVTPSTGTSVNLMTIPNLLTTGESGLLDVAVDPSFATNNRFYTYSVSSATRRLQIDRFTLSSSGATTLASRQTIWTNPGPAAVPDYHVGGSLNISPDGKFFLSTGDNTEGPNSQSLTNVFGKVLRINLDGTIPAGNPFADGAGPNVDEIWARGLRNAFRSSFDKVTGQYWIADVGGNVDSTAYEEVNVIQPGMNYGWPNCEGPVGLPKNGPVCPAGTAGPLYSYTHTVGGGCCANKAIMGGDVYRGTSYPASFAGTYVYADHPTGNFYWLENGAGGPVSGLLKSSTLGGANPTWLGVSPFDGAIYWLHYGWGNNGQLRRLRYTGSNVANPPTVTTASASPTAGPAPLSVSFTAAASDPDGETVTYRWEFGDGTSSTQQNPTHVYSASGVYTAQLSVAAGPDVVAAPPVTISVGTAPTVAITSPADGTTFAAGSSIQLTGTGNDADDGPLTGASLAWSVSFRHNEHSHPVVTGSGPTIMLPVPRSGHGWEGQTAFDVTLTARDSNGLSASTTIELLPQKVGVPITANVPGVVVTVDGVAQALPATVDTIVGFDHAIAAPATVCDGTTQWSFSGWSSGAPISHVLRVPASPGELRATYAQSGSCAPTTYRAINLNGPAVTINGVQFEDGTTAPNLVSGPNRFCNQTVPLTGSPAPNEDTMIRCSVWGRTPGAQALVSSVPGGTYNVWLWVWEDNASQGYDISINGSAVARGIVSGPAGSWQKLGPFPVTVANGTIDVTSSGGEANSSGILIERTSTAPPPPPTTTAPATTPPPTIPPTTAAPVTTVPPTTAAPATTTAPVTTAPPTTPPPTTAAPTTAAPTTAAPTTAAPATTSPPSPAGGQLVVSRAANRSNATALTGATLATNENVYVYLQTALPAVNVRFFLDSPGTGTPFRVEGTAPWDFNGGADATANPYRVQLPNGAHSITAVLTRPDGTTVSFTSPFSVGTTSTPPPTTVAPATTAAPVTTAPTATTQAPATTAPPAGSNGLLRVSRALNRSGGVALAGNTWRVGEQVYVYLDTTLTAVNVRFFLDSPGTGTPFRVEGTAPWDFNGGAELTANPYNVQLPPGSHSITAVLTRPNGTTVTFSSAFTVTA